MALGLGNFLDNPLVGAIAGAMSSAYPEGPVSAVTQQLVNPPVGPKSEVPKPAVAPNRVESTRESMQVRERYPQAKPIAGTRGLGPGVGGIGMNLPGVMSPETLMHPETQALLSQYGVSPEQATEASQTANPNLFIQNPQAFQKHPVLAGLVERGLEGAAFTQGSRTWGEGISNVAQGLLNAQGARADKYNNQLMMPFAQAEQVAHLKGIDLQQQFEQAQAARDNALVKHYGDMDATREELNGIKKQQADTANQLLKFHKTAGLVAAMQKMPPLNEDEQQAVNDTIPENGSIYDADPEVLEKVIASATQRKINADHENKLNVAKTQNAGRVAAAQAGANGRADTTDALNYRDVYNKATSDLKDFNDKLETGILSIDGKQVFADDPVAQTEAKRLQKHVDDAEAAMHRAAQPKTSPIPGRGVAQPSGTPRIRVMDLQGNIK